MDDITIAKELLGVAKFIARNWVYKWDYVKRVIREISSGKLTIEEGAGKLARYLEQRARMMKPQHFTSKGVDMDDENLASIVEDLKDNIIDELENNVAEEDEMDFVLGELYDWGDAYSVWMGM